MKPIPIDQNRRIDLKFIERLEIDDLKEWVSKRLAGDDPYFPLGSPKGEVDPKGVFVWAWKRTPASPYRERFEKVVGDLLEPALAKPENYSASWLDHLLFLVAELKLNFDFNKLIQAFDNPILHRSPYVDVGVDEILLTALAVQGHWVPRNFWLERLKNLQYAPTAIWALEAYGSGAVMAELPNLLRTYIGLGQIDKLGTLLFGLFVSYGYRDFENTIFDRLPRELRVVAAEALERYKISFEVRKSNDDIEKLKSELIRDLSQEWRVVLKEELKSYIISKDEIERKILEATITAKIMGLKLDEQDLKKSPQVTTSTQNPRENPQLPVKPAVSA